LSTVDALTAVLAILVAIAILFEIARRIGVPYPTLFVLGGLGLAFLPALPRIALEPNLVLLVFLPPLLFTAAVGTPIRELRTNLKPIIRLSFGLVLVTMATVAAAMHIAIGLDWPAAFAFGAIVAPTDAIAATSIFRRLGMPRTVVALIEGESLFNDATALVAYRVAVMTVAGGSFVLSDALGGFVSAAAGGIAIGIVVGWAASELLRRLDDPPVEVLISLVIPFAAYLPADRLHLSGVLAAVATGLVIGARFGTILSPNSRVLWLSTWKMVGFVLNGFVFVLVGLELPEILAGLGDRAPVQVLGLIALIGAVVVVTRLLWVFASSLLPSSPRRVFARSDPRLAKRLTFVVAWAGLRGAVSLAAALALDPATFPERNLIILLTFAVILVTLVGQGLTLPIVVRRAGWDGVEFDGDEGTVARAAAYQAGLDEITRSRTNWPDHQPLFDRLEASIRDRTQHLATEDPAETAERRQERIEHEEIQRGVIAAQRTAVIELRDQREISDLTLRSIERELDLEEIRMEA
jgi:monovalent cation/hydrogen antiporter